MKLAVDMEGYRMLWVFGPCDCFYCLFGISQSETANVGRPICTQSDKQAMGASG